VNGPHAASVNAETVVLEWAQKLCDQQFASISELAEVLIQKQYVSSRSAHAFSVMTAAAVKSNSTVDGLLPAGYICFVIVVFSCSALLADNTDTHLVLS